MSGWDLKRTPIKRVSKKKAKADRGYAKARQVVLARAGWECEANVEGICKPGPHPAEHVHHRRLRSQGGTHDPSNLMALCHPAHDFAHANPAAAVELGLIVQAR